MTGIDDGLAPVTPLFGRRGDPAAPSSAGSPGSGPSASERPEGAERHPAGRRGKVGGRPAGGSRVDAEGWALPDSSDEGEALGTPSQNDATAPTRHLSALPTYAAFAAKSEPDLGSEPASEREPDPEPQSEPEESLDAARHRAENVSMHALSRRGVSSSEMEKTLRSRDLPDEVVSDEIERLERVGLLNDAELAENLVRQKQDRKGLGKGAITAELRQRGVDQQAIERAIADIDDDDEQARADEWAIKRAGQLRGLDHETAVRRLNGYLMRRGYRSEVVRSAIDKALPRGGSRSGGVRFE